MSLVNSWLIQQTGYQCYDEAPFAMNHATIANSDEVILQNRKNGILLYLTTNRMLLGVNIADIEQVILVRPPNLVHAIVQAMGRAGRLLSSGQRKMSLIYILFNSQDLGQNVEGMSDEIRSLCLSTQTCLKEMLRKMFVGAYPSNLVPGGDKCCSVCDRNNVNI